METNNSENISKSDNFYNLDLSKVQTELDTDFKRGLKESEVEKRLLKYGKNEFSQKKTATFWQMFVEQLKNPLILILLFVVLVKMVNLVPKLQSGNISVQSIVEVLMVLAVVVISTFIGVKQEMEAEKSLEKLRNQIQFLTRVIRNGEIIEINAVDVVVGDVLVLESGDKIAADARVIESINGFTNESILTGESEEVEKTEVTLATENLGLGDQKNIVFGGTSIVSGKIIAAVYAIGQNTAFGKISKELESTDIEQTKFQKQTEDLLKTLTIFSLSAFVLLEILYIFVLKYDIILSIETGLALVIAFIPEALVAVTTIVLSISAGNLVKKGIIVKNLAAAEGMGSVTTFLTDKTGTITKGQMTVENLWFLDGEVDAGDFKPKTARDQKILEILSFCNNSKGSTELALEEFIIKHQFKVEFFERLFEYGYSSQTKRMTVVRKHNGKDSAFTKGAGDVLLPLCSHYYDHQENKEKKLTDLERLKILEKIESYAAKGLRVLLLAYRYYPDHHNIGTRKIDENELVFTGLICLLDPLRDEVFETVNKFKRAGVKLVMITGDHPNIAKYLANKSGISELEESVMTGTELQEYCDTPVDKLDKDVIKKIYRTRVFARVSPQHKDFLVELFKYKGDIVAMAGDGVNDAVAIKKANIGVAVKNAVDWVKDIAGIVVTGGFDALSNAVEEGRKIIYKARLFSHYLLSGNISQVGVFVLATIYTKYPPLSSLQLLVINLLTDTLPAVALAYEQVPEGIMDEKPVAANEGLINKPIWLSIIIQGVITSIFLFWVFWIFLPVGLIYAQTMTFLAYLCQKLYRAFTARSFTRSIFELGFFSNRITLFSVLGSLAIVYVLVAWVSNYVGMAQVKWSDFGQVALIALVIPVVEEVFKYVRKNFFKN